MKNLKKFLVVCVVILMAVSVVGCGSSTDGADGGEAKVKYKVGIDATYPPFEWQENGNYKGIDVDLIRAIADKAGFDIEIQSMDFKGIIPALQSKQLDIAIAGMSITDERKAVIDFSDPYFDAGLSIVVQEGNDEIRTVDDLDGKTLAVKKGTAGASFATENLDAKKVKIVQFDSSPAMFEEVKSGRADALIEDYPVISYAIAEQGLPLKVVGERLNADQYGIGVLKGNTELLEKINQALSDLKEDGSYQIILDRYLK